MDNQKNLTQLVQDFVGELKVRGRATATILAYGKDLSQLAQFLSTANKELPGAVTSSDIEAFRNALKENNYTDKSASRKLNAIKTFFRWLVSVKLLENDPAAPVAHPRYENQPPRILTKLEYRALRDSCREDARVGAIIELMLQTGMRIGEVANLKRTGIVEDKIVIKAYESQPQREIPLNQIIKDALARYFKYRAKDVSIDHVFVTKTGKPLLVRNIRSTIDRYFEEAGVENAKVNDLRNTFIAHQLASGVDVVTVSRVAGHKRLSTTERYLQFIERKESGRATRLEVL